MGEVRWALHAAVGGEAAHQKWSEIFSHSMHSCKCSCVRACWEVPPSCSHPMMGLGMFAAGKRTWSHLGGHSRLLGHDTKGAANSARARCWMHPPFGAFLLSQPHARATFHLLEDAALLPGQTLDRAEVCASQNRAFCSSLQAQK